MAWIIYAPVIIIFFIFLCSCWVLPSPWPTCSGATLFENSAHAVFAVRLVSLATSFVMSAASGHTQPANKFLMTKFLSLSICHQTSHTSAGSVVVMLMVSWTIPLLNSDCKRFVQ
jgi:hypothetical protein